MTNRGPEDRPKVRFTDKRGQSHSAPEPPATDPSRSQETGLRPDSTDVDAAGPDVVELQQLADDRLDQLMRLKADFENFRKRELREKTELIERASARVAERLLPVLDDLERAIDAARTHATDDSLLRGVELVAQQLHNVLSEEGLELIATEGAFDPEHHEAVASVTGDVTHPTVLQVVRPGYKLKGRTIRPALVQVQVPQEAD